MAGGHGDRFDPGEMMITKAVMAGLALAAAAGLGWLLGWPLILDLHDPEFNPMIFLLAIALGVAAWNGVLAARWAAGARRFGSTELVLEAAHPRLGRPLAGHLRPSRPLQGCREGMRLVLTCEDLHETGSGDSTASRRVQRFPVWSQDRLVPCEVVSGGQVPFRFDLPASVGLKPVSGLRRERNPYFSFNLFVTLPGFRRAYAPGTAPVGRVWTLTARADTDGAPYRASFVIPVEE